MQCMDETFWSLFHEVLPQLSALQEVRAHHYCAYASCPTIGQGGMIEFNTTVCQANGCVQYHVLCDGYSINVLYGIHRLR